MLVTKTFEITFDEPNEDWLCADNLAVALHQVCTNTRFIVKELCCDPPWSNKYDYNKTIEAINRLRYAAGLDPVEKYKPIGYPSGK